MSLGHFLERLGDDAKNWLAGSSVPVPKPGRFRQAAAPQSVWKGAGTGASSQVSVHRDVVAKTSAQIKGDVQDLVQVLTSFASAASGGASITGWSTAQGFSGNVSAVNDSVRTGGGQVAEAHVTAAAKLSTTAASYATAESDITQAISGIAAQLGVMVNRTQAS